MSLGQVNLLSKHNTRYTRFLKSVPWLINLKYVAKNCQMWQYLFFAILCAKMSRVMWALVTQYSEGVIISLWRHSWIFNLKKEENQCFIFSIKLILKVWLKSSYRVFVTLHGITETLSVLNYSWPLVEKRLRRFPIL